MAQFETIASGPSMPAVNPNGSTPDINQTNSRHLAPVPSMCWCGRPQVTDTLGESCQGCLYSPDHCTCDPLPAAGARRFHFFSGADIFKIPDMPPAVWGDRDEILWAEGQALILAGHDGTGKTTFAGNLVRARLGIGDGKVLGYTVTPGRKNVLYLAMDRPMQAMGNLKRLFTEADRAVLAARFKIWQGPPPMDMAEDTSLLAEMCCDAGADTVIIDSLKDAAVRLSEDGVGAGWNRARQRAITAGVQVLELHHPRKPDKQEQSAPKIEDLYGSRWIAAGAGSILMLHGNAGDPYVEMHHRKPVMTAIPMRRILIGTDGTVTDQSADLLQQIRLRGANGITAKIAANLLYSSDDRNATERARRKLGKLTDAGTLYCREGAKGGGADRTETAWFLAAR